MKPPGRLLIVLAVAAAVAFGADKTIGTWKLNVEKSSYSPAPLPIKTLTVTREAGDGRVRVTTTGELANGTEINSGYTVKFDGKDVLVNGNAPYDTIAIKQVNDNTFTDSRKKAGGQYKATGRTVISKDGKTMTTTSKGTDGEGKPFTSTFVLEKQ
jgi:hypothetical protein